MPTIRIYTGEPVCNHDMCDNVMLVVSESQVPPNLVQSMSEGIVDLAISEKAGAMLILDSYSPTLETGHTIDDNDDTNETMKGAASTSGALATLEGMGVEKMVQGAIGGLTGVALSECSRGDSTPWRFSRVLGAHARHGTRCPHCCQSSELP